METVAVGGTGVRLFVYKKIDTITTSGDTINVTLTKTVRLSFTGSGTALGFMAANKLFLFIGTDHTAEPSKSRKVTSL